MRTAALAASFRKLHYIIGGGGGGGTSSSTYALKAGGRVVKRHALAKVMLSQLMTSQFTRTGTVGVGLKS